MTNTKTRGLILATLQHVVNMKDLEFEGFHKFRKHDGSEFGSFEVFYQNEWCLTSEGRHEPGWYWWEAYKGFLPFTTQKGPFPDAEGAYLDALEGSWFDFNFKMSDCDHADLRGLPTINIEGGEIGIGKSVTFMSIDPDGLPSHWDWAIPSGDKE